MEIKRNESTNNRPWGERPLDAPLVPVDLHAFTQQIMEEEAWQKSDRNAITVYKSDAFTIVLVALHKDAEMMPGSFEGTGDMCLQVLEGSIQFTTEEESLELNRAQMVMLHAHIPYTVTALGETVCLLTMAR